MPECEVNFPGSVFVHPRRHANPTRFGQPFQTGGDIDAVAEDIAVLDDDISDIDADSELDPLRESDAGIPDGHPLLHLYGAAQRVYDAAKLDEETVARRFDQSTVMLGDLGVDHLGAYGP